MKGGATNVVEAVGSGHQAVLSIQLQPWEPEAGAEQARALGFWPG